MPAPDEGSSPVAGTEPPLLVSVPSASPSPSPASVSEPVCSGSGVAVFSGALPASSLSPSRETFTVALPPPEETTATETLLAVSVTAVMASASAGASLPAVLLVSVMSISEEEP